MGVMKVTLTANFGKRQAFDCILASEHLTLSVPIYNNSKCLRFACGCLHFEVRMARVTYLIHPLVASSADVAYALKLKMNQLVVVSDI